jgi:hypothetical protein
MEACLVYLKNQKDDDVKWEYLAEYKSYITGMKYYKTPTVKNQVLECVRDLNNKFDTNAILIVDHDKNKLGYVPSELASHIAQNYFHLPYIKLLCYCVKDSQMNSCQSRFCVFQLE